MAALAICTKRQRIHQVLSQAKQDICPNGISSSTRVSCCSIFFWLEQGLDEDIAKAVRLHGKLLIFQRKFSILISAFSAYSMNSFEPTCFCFSLS
jgi:hypothetical protein